MNRITQPNENPFRLNLEQQKKRAKELIKAFNSSDVLAISRFQEHHFDRYESILSGDGKAKLSDAQYIIARELGLSSWPKLKAHISAMSDASASLVSKTVAADDDLKTLHIRCGTDLQTTLPAAGFCGDFLHFSDPYVQGPLTNSADHIKTRSKFLFQAFGKYINKSLSDIQNDLKQEQQKLADSAIQYERVVLWFEHDSFDQLILARILAYFNKFNKPQHLELVTLNHFPGSIRFIGLGQLPPEAIRLLWQQRVPVTHRQLSLGTEIWDVLINKSPLTLFKLLQTDVINTLPNMKKALYRHLNELPSSYNGLGLTEQLTLEILKAGELTGGKLFKTLTLEIDPLPWLGDIMYWFILNSMTQASEDIIQISNNDLNKPWHERKLCITEAGLQLLEGKLDWLSLNPPPRWIGGILTTSEQKSWRWDNRLNKPVFI